MEPTNLEIANRLLSYFRGREDYVARGTDKGFEPVKLPGPMKPEWLRKHLEGQHCAGFYFCDPSSKVWCSAVDFDNKPESPDPEWRGKAEAVYLYLQKAGLSPLVEISASGQAAHVWLFMDEPTPAYVVRAFWYGVSGALGVPFREVYPRQDSLSGKGMGNLMRYPLWNKSQFVNPEDDWREVPPLEALATLRRTSLAELRQLAYDLGFGELKPTDKIQTSGAELQLETSDASEIPPRVLARLSRNKHSLLTRRWEGDRTGLKDQSTSALVLSIATELVRAFVPTPELTAAVRWWCEQNDYAKGLQERALSRCIGQAYEYVFSRVEERSADLMTMRDACHAYLDLLERGGSLYIESGIGELDESIDGAACGEMIVVAARPGHGKSALALQWLDYSAEKGTSSLMISEEMAKTEIGKRCVVAISDLNQEHWRPDYVPMLRRDVDRHYEGRAAVYLVESCVTIERVEQEIEQAVGLRGVRMVAVDYVQLLRARGQSRYDTVTDISCRLKQCAKRHGIALIAVCQMNREIDKAPDREPQLSDLRESGGIEQDADTIVFARWPRKWTTEAPPDEYRLFVKKRRNGPIRKEKIITTFNAERQRVGVFSASPRFSADDETPRFDDGTPYPEN